MDYCVLLSYDIDFLVRGFELVFSLWDLLERDG